MSLAQSGVLYSAGHLEGGGEGTQQVVNDTKEGEGQRDQPQQQACT
jgi:hypothetical protein